jgi:hypothetical protein
LAAHRTCHAFVYNSNGKRYANTGVQIALAECTVIAEKPLETELRMVTKKVVKRSYFATPRRIKFDSPFEP